MSNIKEAFQRFLSIALSVTTTVWLSGITLLLPVSPVLAVAPETYGLKEGDLVRAPSLPAPDGWKVYIINQQGYKRHIYNPDVFNMYGHLKWENIKNVSGDTVNAFTTSDLYRVAGDGKVWSVDANGVRHWLNMTAEEFVQKGYNWNQVFIINATEGNYYTQGSDITSGTTTPPATGGLSVSLSPSTPAGGVLAAGTVFNKVLTARFTAGANAASITSLTVTKDGLIGNSNVTGISVWQGGMRKGNIITSLTSEGKATFTFGTPISVPANSSIDVDIAVNISSSATSGTVGMKINAASDIVAGGTVAGTFPVMGNGFSVISSGQLGAYTITAQSPGGATSFPASGSGNLELGVNRELGKFQFSETTGREDLMVKQVVIYVEGSLQANDIKDWTLVDPSGNTIATGVVEMPYITFNLSQAYRIPEGTNRTLSVKGTATDGADRTLRLHIQNDYDVVLSGFETGGNIAPSSFSDTVSTSGYWRLKQGALSLSRSSDSPSGNVAPGATDVTLAKFDLKATGEDLEIRKMDIEVIEAFSSTTAQQLAGNIKVQSDDGSVTYLSIAANTTDVEVYAANDDNATRHDLSNYLTIKSGETKKIKIVGSIKTTATSPQSYEVRIGDMYAWRASTKDFVDDLGGASSAMSSGTGKGHALTVSSSSLTVKRNDAVTNKTVGKGINDVVLASYVLSTGSAEDVTISSISLLYDSNNSNTNTSADDSSGDVQNLSLWLDGTQFGSTLSSVSTGTTADSFVGSKTLAKNSTKILEVKGNVKTGATSTFSAMVSAVSAVGKDTSNTLTVTNPLDDDGDSSTAESVANDPSLGQDITFGDGSVTITRDSNSTQSKIVLAGTDDFEVERLRFSTLNDNLTMTKLRIEMNASGKQQYLEDLRLYNGSTLLAAGQRLNNEFLFDGLNVSLPAGQDTVLILKSNLADYSIIDAAGDVSVFAIQIKSDSSDDITINGSNGAIGTGSINTSSADSDIAQSRFFLFHAAYPVITKDTISTTQLGGSTTQEVYKFKVKSSSAVPIRLPQVKVKLTTNGMVAAGSLTTFSLWKDGIKVAEDTTTTIAPGGGATASTTATITFDSTNDVNTAFEPSSGTDLNGDSSADSTDTALDGLEIGSTDAVFVVKANTTDMTDGKSSGTVTLTAQIEGASAYDSGDTDQEDDWGDGNIFYSYLMNNTATRIGGRNSSSGFSAAENLPVDAQVLSITL